MLYRLFKPVAPYAITAYLVFAVLGTLIFAWFAIIVSGHHPIIETYWFYTGLNLWVSSLLAFGIPCGVISIEAMLIKEGDAQTKILQLEGKPKPVIVRTALQQELHIAEGSHVIVQPPEASTINVTEE